VKRVASVLAVVASVVGVAAASGTPPAVGLRVVRFTDRTRVVRFRNGVVRSRTLVTYVRYPRAGAAPYPLVVFVHGFALTPAAYARLLDAWASAGYVVAAPLFPGESALAPGGPTESDLINEPMDVRFVITRLLSSPLRRLIDPRRIAVAGQSDGGVAALAAAYADRLRDRRLGAAMVFSGAQTPALHFTYGPNRPPLLAVQGAADSINHPANTLAFFRLAHRPKFLLWLLHGEHLQPYTTDRGQLAIVERVTLAFLDHYLRGAPLRLLLDSAGSPEAQLTADR
jgi:dienelactone hydrolase